VRTRAWVVIVLAVAGTACGLASSAVNEVCLIYEGGLTQDKVFRGILEPGSTNNSVGVGSDTYCYRIDQRTYIAGDPNRGRVDTQPVVVVSDDDVQLATDYQLYFTVNQDEEILRQFHENLGVKTQAWTDVGWTQLLQEYFAPQIERAMEAAALKHEWRDLYGSEETRRAFQTDTVANLKRNINEVIGADYFCGPAYQGPGDECGDFTFTVGKPTPTNVEIIAAVEAEQQAAAATIAQEQENARIRAELEVERELVDLYGAQGALLREAIKSGKVTFYAIPSDGSVPIPAPAPEPGGGADGE
jgi:hypothetical protein